MKNEEWNKKVKDAALDACVVHGYDGEPTQDPWAHDRFKAGVAWAVANPPPEVMALVEAIEEALKQNAGADFGMRGMSPEQLRIRMKRVLAEYEALTNKEGP